ncbi:hypothetical protein [Thalassomonas actiniarum]|uniref:Uncharacterized protein n=1 Tax=Thalassomonas actiniarum TaxID=485447 RepID=A0AAF0C6I5_9GAMM|nr:hypothetical protein [Thalassomonas actiniarum]WDE02100.1 hypothetical protein SG35_030520 [Thalassomonas actiniarum]
MAIGFYKNWDAPVNVDTVLTEAQIKNSLAAAANAINTKFPATDADGFNKTYEQPESKWRQFSERTSSTKDNQIVVSKGMHQNENMNVPNVGNNTPVQHITCDTYEQNAVSFHIFCMVRPGTNANDVDRWRPVKISHVSAGKSTFLT